MYGCGEQEVGVASGSGWNPWVWLLGVVLRRYIDFLILLIPTPLVSVLFCSSIPTFLFIFLNVFRSCCKLKLFTLISIVYKYGILDNVYYNYIYLIGNSMLIIRR